MSTILNYGLSYPSRGEIQLEFLTSQHRWKPILDLTDEELRDAIELDGLPEPYRIALRQEAFVRRQDINKGTVEALTTTELEVEAAYLDARGIEVQSELLTRWGNECTTVK